MNYHKEVYHDYFGSDSSISQTTSSINSETSLVSSESEAEIIIRYRNQRVK